MDYILEQLDYSEVENDFVFPESCNTFYDRALYISDYAHGLVNEMMEEIGVQELKSFEENGSLVIYEGKALALMKIKFDAICIRIWRALDAFWNDVLKVFNKGEKATYVKINKETIASLKDNKVYGKTHKFFNEDEISFAQDANKFIEEVNKVYEGLIDNGVKDIITISKATDKLEAIVCSKVSGIAGVKTNSQVKKALKKKLIGDEYLITKRVIAQSADAIYTIATSNESVMRAKKEYENQRKVFWKLMKSIEDKFNDDFLAVAGQWINVILDVVSVLNTCYAVECDVLVRRRQEYRNIMAKLNSIQNKVIKAENEAAEAAPIVVKW